jgi:sterol desaturase/sphingolipid hydroxylase (fatty acid hydroxylase superfamily)
MDGCWNLSDGNAVRKRNLMRILRLEHSKSVYVADFALYGLALVALAVILTLEGPGKQRPELLVFILFGLLGWTLIEYLLHRFVLHGMPPFRTWHAEHHQRPAALICTPTVLSGSLIIVLIFLPAWALSDLWSASALTFGIVAGYLAYSVTHHAIHHWRTRSVWLKRRKHMHALHHQAQGPVGYFGVTSVFWDIVFGSMPPRQRPTKSLSYTRTLG